MNKLLELFLIILAVIAVGIADVMIKKIAFNVSNFFSVLKNPFILVIILLYVIQILIFAYLFVNKSELTVVGIMQMALYAIIVLTSGIFFFKEEVNTIQIIGIGLAIIGVVLINV